VTEPLNSDSHTRPGPGDPPDSVGPGPTRSKSQSKMMRKCENEMFTFEIDSEIALVGCTLER